MKLKSLFEEINKATITITTISYRGEAINKHPAWLVSGLLAIFLSCNCTFVTARLLLR